MGFIFCQKLRKEKWVIGHELVCSSGRGALQVLMFVLFRLSFSFGYSKIETLDYRDFWLQLQYPSMFPYIPTTFWILSSEARFGITSQYFWSRRCRTSKKNFGYKRLSLWKLWKTFEYSKSFLAADNFKVNII